MRNPFIDESADLHALYYKEILEDTMVRTLGDIKTIDEKIYSECVEQRLVDTTTPISHPLSKQQLPIFSNRVAKLRFRSQLEVADLKLKVDRDLMSP